MALILSMVLCFSCGGAADESGGEVLKPRSFDNILVLLVDTLRADHLPTFGYHRQTAPNLERLLASSVVFIDSWSAAACTFPSVNSLLTSQPAMFFVSRGTLTTGENGEPSYEDVHSYWQSPSREARFGIPKETPVLPEILREHGFFTMAVSASPIVRAKPSKAPGAVNRWGGFGRGFDVFYEECLKEDAAVVNETALRLLDQRPDRPFFMYLHYLDPHAPYRPPSDYALQFAGAYDGKEFIAKGIPYPIARALRRGEPAGVDARDIGHLIDLYDDEIAYFDRELGRLMEQLAERGLLDSTLIVIVADHGESFLEHGRNIVHCSSVYESEVRVPLVLRFPGHQAGKKVQVPAQGVDLMPTLLDLVGIDTSGLELTGTSLRPLISGSLPETAHPRYAFSAQRAGRSVSDGRYKLMYDMLERRLALYDLQNDPGETVDIKKSRPEVLARLQQVLFELIKRTEGGVDSQQSLLMSQDVDNQLRALGYLH